MSTTIDKNKNPQQISDRAKQQNSEPRKLLNNLRQYTSSLIVASRGICKPSSSSGSSSRVEEALLITMNRSRDILRILSKMEDKLEGFEGGSAKRSLERYTATQPTFLKRRKLAKPEETRIADTKLPKIEVIDIE